MATTVTAPVRIALIGDRNPAVIAHVAIARALSLASAETGIALQAEWVHTATLGSDCEDRLHGYAAFWCVPGSPYSSTQGALAAIRHARERGRPFLGTCGGFQHALLEYARNGLGFAHAAHAELHPDVDDPVVAPLACSLLDESGTILLDPDSHLARVYGMLRVVEGYHCRYGLAPTWEQRLMQDRLRVTGRDPAGEVRAVELEGHPFFVATLFQPERSALAGVTPPVVRAFVSAAAAAAQWDYRSGTTTRTEAHDPRVPAA
ncbi:MAG TPA: CTP synthase [Gemmatimonadaceae bacterium]